MKQGISLVAMAEELERQRPLKRDFVADSRRVVMTSGADGLSLALGGDEVVAGKLTPYAEKQLAGRLNLPVPVYTRLREKYPDKLAGLVDAMFQREPQKFMTRFLDGKLRAVMTDGYRPIDNYDYFEAIYPTLAEYQQEGLMIESVNLTETKLYIKAIAPWLNRELAPPEGAVMGKGHTIFLRKVIGAVSVGNSEVGDGMAYVDPGIFEEACTNLAVFRKEGYGRIHVGKKKGVEGAAFEYASDHTKRLEDAVIFSKLRDALKAALDGKAFEKICGRLDAARADAITGNPAKVVEVFSVKQGLNEHEKGGLLRLLAGSGEMTRYGLQWAVTRLAGEVDDYDRASELEVLGGRVIELPKTEWEELAQAA